MDENEKINANENFNNFQKQLKLLEEEEKMNQLEHNLLNKEEVKQKLQENNILNQETGNFA